MVMGEGDKSKHDKTNTKEQQMLIFVIIIVLTLVLDGASYKEETCYHHEQHNGYNDPV
jgi:hypothetical protein